ncbi:MAG TPA: prolyl oligopeptidase family serine peptidase [Bryobacteraceae bacterium]|nr:prolyl oligopeptidase family serine peptidase [Bryobacteraceae bacterium]
MKRTAVLLLAFAAACLAQVDPDKVAKAHPLIDELAKSIPSDPDLRADVEIYLKAAQWTLRHPEEFFRPATNDQLLAVLQRGLQRAKSPGSWKTQKGRLSRGYISRVDGSVQPYGLIIPEGYDPTKPTRLDVVLHGRADTQNEVNFLFAHDSDKPIPATQRHMVLEVYGRGNNAYRWAGESDVFEALDSVRKRYNIDPNRIVLRGFSMGGAGTWHIGLHHPDRWAAIEAGAGFSETRIYAKLPPTTPEHQLRALHIYDALDYAENAAMVPTVGYGGELDPQRAASQHIQRAIAGRTDVKSLFLIGPKTEHKWHPDSQKESDAFIDAAVDQGRRVPDRIHFVTYTTRYNRCFWLTIDALDQHYERAQVDGTRGDVTTRNVAALTLDREGSPLIDGQKPGRGRSFVKVDGKWRPGTLKGPRKKHGLQGPIDDAFMDSFTTVDPPEKVRTEWAKWMRGELPVSAEPVKGKHLVVFGDYRTNRILRKVNADLPIQWVGDDIVAGNQRFAAADHTLAMICPNPLDPTRYLVVNSGLTFGEKEFRGTNALLFPRLGDFAIIRKSDGAVVLAGFFDEQWRFPASKR